MNAPAFAASAREGAVASIVRACLKVARGVSDYPEDRLANLIIHRSAMTPTSRADAAALALVAVKFVASLTPVTAAAAVIARKRSRPPGSSYSRSSVRPSTSSTIRSWPTSRG
jgi:hypothetical protein